MIRRCVTAVGIAAVALLCSGGSAGAIGFEPIALSLATDGAGHVYLSNPLHGSIQQYSDDGTPLASLGSFEATSNPFLPRGIATDAGGALYIADGSGGMISVLGADGATLREWSAMHGRDIAVGPDGSVYLAEAREIQRFSSTGAPIAKWGGGGGPFGEVWGLDTGPSGRVYVADTYGNQIQVFTADGAFVAKWGQRGSGEGQLFYPYGIAVSASEEVYVADTVNDRVQRFSASGQFLGAWGKSGSGHGRFHTPTSIAIDPAGFVYVADRAAPYPAENQARVQKFTAEGRFVTQWFDGPRDLAPGPPRLSASVPSRTTRRSATFRFHSRAKGPRYSCRLTGALVPARLRRWRACASPKRYARLRPGRKTFHVRAIRGRWIGAEAKRSWLIVPAGSR